MQYLAPGETPVFRRSTPCEALKSRKEAVRVAAMGVVEVQKPGWREEGREGAEVRGEKWRARGLWNTVCESQFCSSFCF